MLISAPAAGPTGFPVMGSKRTALPVMGSTRGFSAPEATSSPTAPSAIAACGLEALVAADTACFVGAACFVELPANASGSSAPTEAGCNVEVLAGAFVLFEDAELVLVAPGAAFTEAAGPLLAMLGADATLGASRAPDEDVTGSGLDGEAASSATSVLRVLCLRGALLGLAAGASTSCASLLSGVATFLRDLLGFVDAITSTSWEEVGGCWEALV